MPRRNLTVDSIYPQKGTYPGDTVKVQDPPTSNGASTDSFGEDKGLVAPPGARGEFVEGRPQGNIGVPIQPISPSVTDTNRRRRDTIPPMFLPSVARRAEYEVFNEETPVDTEPRTAVFERSLIDGEEAARKRSFSVYPIPSQHPAQDERLLLQIPHDVQERYNDLHRRVSDYVKRVKLNTLDMFDFPKDPPQKWVEEERYNVPIDWSDDGVWSSFLSRLSHDDLADWVGLEAIDGGKLAELAPELFTQHALEAPAEEFASWFRSRRPTVADGKLLDYVKETAKAFPEHGLGKGYTGAWRRRHHDMVREEATHRATERHDRYLREVSYGEYVRPQMRDAFETVNRSRNDSLPLSDVVSALRSLPFDAEDADEVSGFGNDYESMINEGVHALDLYREPVSRDDRLVGDMEYMGERFVPARRIAKSLPGYPKDHQVGQRVPKGGSSCAKCKFVSEDKKECGEEHFVEWNGSHELPAPAEEYCCDFFKEPGDREALMNDTPVALYKYGSVYFLVHESDRHLIRSGMFMVRAQVYDIVPGSSQAKRSIVALADWQRKANALSMSIREIQAGNDREEVFSKYGREYGPGLRKAVSDYLYVSDFQKTSEGGGGGAGSTAGDSTCSSFAQQSPDNCDGCTFNSGTGGPEFGYGDGGCLLTHLFLNAPDKGFGRGDTAGYDDLHRPGPASVQDLNRTRRSDPRNIQ